MQSRLEWRCEDALKVEPKHLFVTLWQDLTLRHGWRTAAIVPELEQETKVVSTSQYAVNLTWLQALTGLIERLQVSLIQFWA